MINEKSTRGWVAGVVLPAAIALIILALCLGAVLYFSANRSDALSAARQQQIVFEVVRGARAELADQHHALDEGEAAPHLHKQLPDLGWIHSNLGLPFFTRFGHDEVYILDQGNRPIYALRDGIRAAPDRFEQIRSQSLALAVETRTRISSNRSAQDGAVASPAAATDLATIDQLPVIIGVRPLADSRTTLQAGSQPFLHVTVRSLDHDFLAKLTNLGIEGAHFVGAPEPGPSLALRNNAGVPVSHLVWQPFRPGQQVRNALMPHLLIALIVLGAVISWLLTRTWRNRTELEVSRAHAQRLAFHDSLTGLPNRALFEDRLTHALARARGNASLGVLLLDLDRFKNVNDTLGHQAGDALICQFAQRLSEIMRTGDTIARLGGDEFAILVEDTMSRDIPTLCQRILDAVRKPFDLLGSQAFVGVSIGVSFAPDAARTSAELIRTADIALYRAKNDGRDCFKLFNNDMDATVKLRSSMEDDLRAALTSGSGLCLHYQPQVDAAGQVIGLEALVRWDHPRLGLLAPPRFLPIAEETGLIVALGEWVFREACAASRRWPDLSIAINLSIVQFRSADFAERVKQILSDNRVSPSKIQLEVSEQLILDRNRDVAQTLRDLRKLGFRIVLDDFGTCYSLIGILKEVEVDKIKIDRHFVSRLSDGGEAVTQVGSLLALGKAMGMTVAAQGVETPEQQTLLAIAGCQELQGHLFAPALPQNQVTVFLPTTARRVAAAS